ncbi:MAG: tryptophan synthase subunit alpha [archaeon]|nr:MAG: tryptophan synthase subunit alpha [archaeon]
MSRISEAIMGSAGGLVAYVMGGDPGLGRSERAIEAVLRGGADVLEVGVPFSDPIADGKSIQAASVRALGARTTPGDVLELVARVRKRFDSPIALMSYFNPILSKGPTRFLEEAKESGVDGLIVPDLPLEEAGAFGRSARRRGIDSILLATPTTSGVRMKEIVRNTSGFLYLVSLLGVTGAREELGARTSDLVRLAKKTTEGRVPLAVGFGISKPGHVKAVIGAGADAAIVGSAIVDRIAASNGEMRSVQAYVRSMKNAAMSSA